VGKYRDRHRVGVVMLVIAVAGIKVTARIQVGMAVIEYILLIGFGIAGLVAVLLHRHGTIPLSQGWLSLGGIGGKGSAASGFLVAVFMFTGWDGTLYVNEEVTNRYRNPGRAAIAAVAVLAVIYTLCTAGLQGTVPAKALQDNAASALVYTAQAIGGGWPRRWHSRWPCRSSPPPGPGSCCRRGSSTGWRAVGCCRRSWATCPPGS
jgi:amino acid transporter